MACTIKVNGNAQSVDIGGRVGLAQDINRHRRRFFGPTTLRFLVTTAGMIAALAVTAEAAGNLKQPVGYRYWYHVNTMVVDKASPLFAALRGMHNVHVNSTGEPALKKGGPYPNGTMFVIDLHNFAVVDGSYVEGPVKRLALMEKDTKNTPRLAVGAFNSGREEIPGRQWSPMQPNNASDAISPK